MSYATMRDVLFALDLTDSELRDRPRRHPDVPAAEPELPEERGESRRVTKPKAVAKPKVAKPKAVVERSRAA
jgi:hypothetical protein